MGKGGQDGHGQGRPGRQGRPWAKEKAHSQFQAMGFSGMAETYFFRHSFLAALSAIAAIAARIAGQSVILAAELAIAAIFSIFDMSLTPLAFPL